ncbi:MAG TPA: 3-hydroxyacyl-CoA dehydrogenase NAD-binding domain-containing protein [Longimicrobiaceae bacterium]|nr:3-hydroxyacyl-CoA dehydrogenase NAD-binding domain-containing protein [Longimicrobiaceae bacterium]
MPTAEQQVESGPSVRMTIEDGIAVVRLDQPGKPVNVLSRELVDGMAGVIGRLEAGEARAAVILSGKPGAWIAGADIEEFRELHDAADGERLSRTAHDLLGRLERLGIPVVAAIDGVALGGGLEVALACAYRLATDSPKTKLGSPEVQLGILPGAGGTQRLPRLIGLRAALDLMLTGRQLDARRARKLGLVDEVVPAAALERVALRTARELIEGRKSPRAGRRRGSPLWFENLPGVRAFIFRAARQGVVQKTHGLYPAPLRILSVVERGIDRPLGEALELEAKAFGELSVTPEARALTHVFLASTAARNDPELPAGATAADVERVAVVGAGFMGSGIAVASAEGGLRVRLKDVSADAVARGLAAARKSLVKRAERRRRRPFEITTLTDRLEGTSEYTGFAGADLVVEAVFEDVELKHRVIREIEEASAPETIVGSNTSTIPITTLAGSALRPERLIGLHFFSPVEKMPLVEIIVTGRTSPDTAATSHRFAKRIGKTPIIVNDAPGFYVNRILAPYMNEAALLLVAGVPMQEIDAAMVAWGFPVGPITLFDEVGLDVAAKSGKIMQEAFGERIPGNDAIARLTADGRLGRKNGRGFYRYENGKRRGPDEAVYALLGSPVESHLPAAEIQDRLALGMVNEAVRCLEEGVLRSARDGDVGAVFGIGFPPFRGGPFWFVDHLGPATVVERLQALAASHGPRFAPAPLLVRAAESGEGVTSSGRRHS